VTDILNCPFCGNAGRISYSDRGETFSVRCVSWGAPATACMGSGPYAYSEADAIAAWNRRVLATPSTGAVGYVTVPAEPTEAMRQAFYGGDSIGLLPEWFAKSYRAMIAAAPPSSPSERDAALEDVAARLSIQLFRWNEIDIEPKLLIDPLRDALKASRSDTVGPEAGEAAPASGRDTP
jgi:hypothetical protein